MHDPAEMARVRNAKLGDLIDDEGFATAILGVLDLAARWLGSRRRLAHGLAFLELTRCEPPALAASHGNLVQWLDICRTSRLDMA